MEDLKARGLTDLLLAIIDGNAGVRKTLRHKCPHTLVQRCQVHRMRNVLTKLHEVGHPLLKKLILKTFTAGSYVRARSSPSTGRRSPRR